MLALVDFSFEFAGRYLFKNANWHIKPNEKIGLVGLNGTGKSTVLRLIAGDYELREGTISKPGNLKIGFLNQDLLSIQFNDSLLHVVKQGRDDLANLDLKIEKLLVKIETDPSDNNIQQLTEIQEQFGMLGGYEWQNEAEKILEGLGFETHKLNEPLSTFSGGWRMRAMLAKLLLQKPDLLLLDEPTNHLDLPTIQWLEDYLKTYEGTYIIVSHDPLFLDNTVNRIAEVAHQTLFHYKGNYNQFLDQKDERDEMMQRRFDNQQDFIRQQMRFIERFRYKASKANAVQSRLKQLEKIDKIELQEDESRNLNIRFNIKTTPGKVLHTLENIDKNYDDLQILKNGNATIFRGDKIALIGANGKGKSTLLRIINGTEKFTGKSEPGWNAETAFFAQHQLEALQLKNNLVEELATVSAEYSENELRTTLGCFLFTGDEVFKKIKVLSGGEKSRVALAKTLLTKANFLLLDEPTNHLDMFSCSVLAESLIHYKGTCIIVSHDRTFISKVANKIWWIENHEIKEFPGTYAEYTEYVEKRNLQNVDVIQKPIKSEPIEKKIEAKTPPQSNKNSLQQLEKKMQLIEEKINNQKQTLENINQKLISPEVAVDFEKIGEFTNSYKKIETELAQTQKEYDLVFEEWMKLNN